jgi:hypothetical protein
VAPWSKDNPRSPILVFLGFMWNPLSWVMAGIWTLALPAVHRLIGLQKTSHVTPGTPSHRCADRTDDRGGIQVTFESPIS